MYVAFAMRPRKCSNLRVSNRSGLKRDYGFCLAAHESTYQDFDYVKSTHTQLELTS